MLGCASSPSARAAVWSRISHGRRLHIPSHCTQGDEGSFDGVLTHPPGHECPRTDPPRCEPSPAARQTLAWPSNSQICSIVGDRYPGQQRNYVDSVEDRLRTRSRAV